MEKLKNKKIIIPIIAVVLILLLGITFAWLTKVLRGDKINVIKAGDLDLVLNETSQNGINLLNALPMTDSDGMSTAAYTFSVVNNSSTNVDYQLFLDDVALEDGEVKLDDSNLRYSLKKNSGTDTAQALTSREIESTSIASNATNEYELRIWIDINATNEIVGQVFKAKLRVEATQPHPGGSASTAANTHIKNVYKYDENSSSATFCLGGAESSCEEVTNLTNTTSYDVGTVVKYEVSDGVYKYFNVLYDNGSTLTLQQRENTIYSTPWYLAANQNNQGPTTVLPALESATESWSYVNSQTYKLGTTEFGSETYKTANTGAPWAEGGFVIPNTNTYTLASRTAKARMITVQEAYEMGCKRYASNGSSNMSCKKFMNNYLYESTTYGGTVVDDYHTGSDHNYGYWTASAVSSDATAAFFVNRTGTAHNYNTSDAYYGARAVVVVQK